RRLLKGVDACRTGSRSLLIWTSTLMSDSSSLIFASNFASSAMRESMTASEVRFKSGTLVLSACSRAAPCRLLAFLRVGKERQRTTPERGSTVKCECRVLVNPSCLQLSGLCFSKSIDAGPFQPNIFDDMTKIVTCRIVGQGTWESPEMLVLFETEEGFR